MFIYYIPINVITFILFGIDKLKAKSGMWRISEKVLIGFAAAGGAFGAFLGMQIFRHKTKKILFNILIPILMAIHVGIIIFFGGNDEFFYLPFM